MTTYATKILSYVRVTIWAIQQLFFAAPKETLALTLLIIMQGLIPAASLIVIKEIVNWLSISSEFPLFLIILWACFLAGDVLLSPIAVVTRIQLNEKVRLHFNELLMLKANSIESLMPFENSHFYDEIQFLKTESASRPLNFVYIITDFLKSGIILLSVLITLFTLSWWIPLAIILVNLPHAISTLWFEKQSWNQMLFKSPTSRKLSWISSVTMDEKFAKEIRLFNFGHFLVERYKSLINEVYSSLFEERWKKAASSIFLSLLTVSGNIVIIVFVLFKTKSGTLQLGDLVLSIQALFITQEHLAHCIANIGMATPVLLFFKKIKLFLNNDWCPISSSNLGLQSLPSEFNEVEFKNVSFRYSDGREALSEVSFKVHKGQKIAIVGENGAGKSTLVKLLLRFYDPSEGTILIDGVDLKCFDIKSWRTQISGVFQDFGQYHFSVKENISLGDVKATEEDISLAAMKGGFTPILKKLSNGFDSILGKEFGGTSLSGGEWQKLAMSRAFLRDSKILILDEPTASMDPQSELEIFNRFYAQTREKTAILITHRLGSVKMADRILVFKKGCLIEDGTHDELVSQKGEYNTLYHLQADMYKKSPLQNTADFTFSVP